MKLVEKIELQAKRNNLTYIDEFALKGFSAGCTQQSTIHSSLRLLCKRLNKFTLEAVLLYADFDQETLKKQLLNLLNGGYIKKNGNRYIYESMDLRKKSKKKNKQLPLMFQHHTPETIDLIVKCFCADISSQKVSYLTGFDDSCISYFCKKIHCYLKRIEGHNKNKFYLHLNIAERLWRRERELKELKEKLGSLTNKKKHRVCKFKHK